MTMAEKTDRIDEPEESAGRLDETAAAPFAREPWATPRVLAFQRFDGTGGPPDNFPTEGFFYGPS